MAGRTVTRLFWIAAAGLAMILFQNASTLDQGSLCPPGHICDRFLQGSFLIRHPNPKSIDGGSAARDYFAWNVVVPGQPPQWIIDDMWSSYPLIASSHVDVRSNRRVLHSAPIQRFNGFTQGTLQFLAAVDKKKVTTEDLHTLRVFQSPTHAFISNGDREKADRFGDFTYAFNTWKEYFGETDRSDLMNQLKGKSGPVAKAILKKHLIRNEDGLANTISGQGRPCHPVEKTFVSGALSRYCKHPHFQLSPANFARTPLGQNGFSLGISIRLFKKSEDAAVNQALSDSELSSYYAHMNLRMLLRRPRSHALKYRDPRKGDALALKTEDAVVLSFPLFASTQFCLDPSFASKHQGYCGKNKPLLETSQVAPRPDYGTFQFMYKFGLGDLGPGMAAQIRRLATGRWVRFEINQVPRFTQALRQASAACLKGAKGWGLPVPICDIESFDLSQYELQNISIGAEVSGAWDIGLQMRDIKFSFD